MKRWFMQLGILGVLVAAMSPSILSGQVTVQFQEEGHYYYPPFVFDRYSGLTPVIDKLGRDYVYLASVEKGLMIFDISQPGNPVVADSLPTNLFQGAKVMSATQVGTTLYLAVGSFWSPQPSGLAIVDVSNPTASTIVGQWDSTAFDQGCAEVLVAGDIAYLALLERGVAILDISTPSQIRFLSRILPDVSFGSPPYDPGARGLSLHNDTLLVAYDAGGLRAIDVHDPQNPVEIGKYVNSTLRSVANPAYNKVLRIGDYAWVPVDYCGLEVIDVHDVTQMQSVAWYNPWGCNNLQSGHQWIGSDYHLNEIALVAQDSVIYISGGDKEVIAFDARRPQQLIPVGNYGAVNDTIVAWGVDARGDRIALGLQYNAIDLPNRSKVGGLRMLRRDLQTHAWIPESPEVALQCFPVPVQRTLQLRLSAPRPVVARIALYNVLGIEVAAPTSLVLGPQDLDFAIDCQHLPAGTYLLQLETATQHLGRLVVVQR